ncbi:hypothetical protein C0Q70_16687 [Pomacea canaliculata]|uniref:Uncharacterized protein n=1 Tax=Pomacea canaliculata TaxID=400727 RepID=A0A2T7NQH1_POMCA|nr:hypothetical protein C0Q70_16687 [Pomacea canaliculata]
MSRPCLHQACLPCFQGSAHTLGARLTNGMARSGRKTLLCPVGKRGRNPNAFKATLSTWVPHPHQQHFSFSRRAARV